MTGAYAELDERAIAAAFAADGFVSIPGFLDAGEITEMRNHLARFVREVVPRMPATEVYREVADNAETLKQLQNLHVHDEVFRSHLEGGPLAQLAAVLLGDTPAPQNLQYFDKPPGHNRATPPHQDGAYFPIDPMNAVTIWLALEDVGSEQGCVHYVRGSHREGLRPHRRGETLGFSRELVDYGARDAAREVAFPCAAGHVIAHHALTVHRAGGNETRDRHRRALGFIYFAASCTIDEQARAERQARLDAELRAAGRLATTTSRARARSNRRPR